MVAVYDGEGVDQERERFAVNSVTGRAKAQWGGGDYVEVWWQARDEADSVGSERGGGEAIYGK